MGNQGKKFTGKLQLEKVVMYALVYNLSHSEARTSVLLAADSGLWDTAGEKREGRFTVHAYDGIFVSGLGHLLLWGL
jgi:hypothetical protein